MPAEQPGQQQSFMDRMRQQLNVLTLIAGVFTTFAEVTLFRKQFGERYFQGLRPILVVPLLLFWPVFWPYEDPRVVLCCLPAYIVACALHRATIVRRRTRGGPSIHSYYNGRSWLMHRYGKLGERVVKTRVEPLVMLLMGLGALTFSPPLGWLFVWTAAGMAFHAGLLHRSDRQQALDLADAAIDSEHLAARARELRGDTVRIHRSHP
jgi:hypothetical protein